MSKTGVKVLNKGEHQPQGKKIIEVHFLVPKLLKVLSQEASFAEQECLSALGGPLPTELASRFLRPSSRLRSGPQTRGATGAGQRSSPRSVQRSGHACRFPMPTHPSYLQRSPGDFERRLQAHLTHWRSNL